jgi:osmotically-inducible protein OsmY
MAMVVTGNKLEEQVLKALQQDERTQGQQIEVVDSEGVVTLAGVVSSREARAAAGQIAEGQDGVEEVINDLRVEEEDLSSSDPLVMPPPSSG